MNRVFRRAVLLGVAAVTGVALSGCGSTATPAPAAPATGTTTAGPPGSPGTVPASTPAPAPSATAVAGLPAGYLPLFPFVSLTGARAWAAGYPSGGHQPWHLSADLTATAFAAYLGYTEVTEVAHHAITGGDAHVTVGGKLPDGHIAAAAIVHLLKFGSGRYAPWEVVGTDDTTFSLGFPAYGSTAASPVTVGGKISGADENIRVTVRELQAMSPAGSYCCRPAGGTAAPWSVSVAFHAAPGRVITVAASTGGHVATVERFTVTGLRTG